MSETETMFNEPRSLNMDDGWEEQVNRNAMHMSFEMDEQERRTAHIYHRRQEREKAKRMVYGIYTGMFLILAACCCLAYADFIPKWILSIFVLLGVAVYAFTFGWFAGTRKKGY